MKDSDRTPACLVDSERDNISVSRWHVLIKSSVSLITLEGPYFLEMLKEQALEHSRRWKNPDLSTHNTKKRVDFEYELMMRKIK